MINLELKERQRQYEVILKQIPEVPKLANEVIGKKKEVDRKKADVEELSRYLEDPECTDKR